MSATTYGSEYGVDLPGGILGSTDLTASQDNSGNTGSLGNSTGGDGAFVGEGVRSGIDSWDKAYTNAGGKFPSGMGLSDLKKFISDNKEWIAGAGALAGIYGGGSNADKKTGYQGVIPTLSASRSMIAAPPTRKQGYRPGAGGIDYGGDVSYRLAPGMDPYANLLGTSGSAAGADLTGLPGAPAVNTVVTVPTSTGEAAAKRQVAGPTPILPGEVHLGNGVFRTRDGITVNSQGVPINQTSLAQVAASNTGDAAAKRQVVGSTPILPGEVHLGNGIFRTRDGVTINSQGVPTTPTSVTQATPSNTGEAAAQRQVVGSTPIVPGEVHLGNGVFRTPDGSIINSQGTPVVQATTPAFVAPTAVTNTAATNTATTNAATNNILANNPPANQTVNQLAELQALANVANVATNNAAVTAPASYYDEGAGMEMLYPQADSLQNLGLLYEPYYGGDGGFAEGGMAKGRYLQGGTDGMADKLPARIGADQPAALSHGEFVIPADVVSHMGNGNSDAGAKKLYQMMDKIRMARTGTKKQGKKINPDKFMPGGLAQAYASGGEVKHFEVGGLTTANKNAAAGISGIESNLSNWAGPYVTNMLGQGQALANMPYQAYMGPLTSGESPLQTSAFNTAAGLTTPTSISNAATTAGNIATKAKDLAYSPTTSSFDSTQLTNYMNPYLDKILTPQLEAARRQSEITQQQNAGQMTKAGAYGGGRQAIMDTETQRNLADVQANITGKGYDTAYQNALSQFNADQQRKMQEGQFGASYGLQGLNTGLQAAQTQGQLGATQASTGLANLNAQLSAGAQQRGIESEGIAADKAQFEEARANPYKMVQYQQSLLQGLPLAAQSYQGIEPNALLKASQGATSVNALLKNLGLIS